MGIANAVGPSSDGSTACSSAEPLWKYDMGLSFGLSGPALYLNSGNLPSFLLTARLYPVLSNYRACLCFPDEKIAVGFFVPDGTDVRRFPDVLSKPSTPTLLARRRLLFLTGRFLRMRHGRRLVPELRRCEAWALAGERSVCKTSGYSRLARKILSPVRSRCIFPAPRSCTLDGAPASGRRHPRSLVRIKCSLSETTDRTSRFRSGVPCSEMRIPLVGLTECACICAFGSRCSTSDAL